MNFSPPPFDVPFVSVPGINVGPISQLIWGPSGTLIEGLKGVARGGTPSFAVFELFTSKQRWVARPGDLLWVGPDKSITLGAQPVTTKSGPDKHAEFSAPTQSAWDPRREVLVRFGGVAGPKFSNATREWRDGAWREVKVKNKPIPRNLAAMCWVPPLGGVAMFGGWNNKDGHLSDTALFDGQDWTLWPSALPEGAIPTAPTVLFFDEPSSQLIHLRAVKGRGIGMWRYAGEGQWALAGSLRLFPEIEDDYQWSTSAQVVRWAFDAQNRRVLAASPQNGISMASIDLGAWLDGLPKVTWEAAAKPATPPAPVARIPQRFLVSREGGVGKFWFAAIEGASWTARWGRRGRPAQSTTHEFDSADLAARDFDKKVQEKLDGGYADAPNGERAAQLEGATAYPIKFVKQKADGDFVYGRAGIEEALWPKCAGCKKPMKGLGVFHAHPERLPLGSHAALALFQCEAGCPAWDPNGGANAALLLDHVTAPFEPAEGNGETQAAQWIGYEKPTFEIDYGAEGIEDDRAPGGSKVGGTPTWVQTPEVPKCDTCKGTMRLAVQLDSGETGMAFGDLGIGYAFVCRDGHQAKFLAQGS